MYCSAFATARARGCQMSAFTPLKRNCPICDGERRDCRQNKENSIIHCRASLSIVPSGWKALGQDKWGFEMYAPASNEQSSQDWHHRQREQQAQRQREKEELRRGALPEGERDQAIRRIHRHFGISNKHRQNLRDRGLLDAHIDRLPYFTFHSEQKVPHFTPANLPGVRRGRLTVVESGFACPIPNIDGQFIGWQNRFDDLTNGKYRWPSGEKSSHLPSGELPIGVYHPDGGVTRRAIGHSEGFLKADITAQQWGLPTLGAASANFAASTQQWKASLDQLSAELCTRTIYWFVDAGAVANPSVTNQYLKSWEKLTEWGYSVKVIWWGQLEKAAGDADEISQEVRESARLISIDEYLAIAREHGGIREQSSSYTPSTQGIDRTITRDEWELKHGFGKRIQELAEANQARTFKNWLTSQVQRQAKRLTNWSKTLRGQGETPKPIPAANPARGGTYISSLADIRDPEVYRNEGAPLLLYPAGEMAAVWQRARFKRYKAIFDVSLMGTGKSEIAGRQNIQNWFLQPDQGEISEQRLAYFSQSGENTTAPSLERWTPLARMHNGLIERNDKLTGGGNPFVERPKPGETPSIPGNCWATSLQHLLSGKNIGHGGSHAVENGDLNPICNLCSERESCKEGAPGDKASGFKAQMKSALKSSRIKGTLAGFPGNHNFEIVAFIDEAGATLQDTKDIEASIADIDKEFFRLYQHSKELYDAFSFIQGILTLYLSEEKQPRYGYDFATIKSWFAEKHLDSFEFEWALRTLEESTRSQIQRELKTLKEGQSDSDVNELVTLNWLIPFCRVMSGTEPGSVRIVNNKLIITVKNNREVDLIRSFDFTVFLDATGDRDELARKLGYQPWEILWVMEAPRCDVFSNLRVLQITGLGKCGKDRRNLAQKRIEATEKAIEDWLLGNEDNRNLEILIGKRQDIFPNGVNPEKIAYLRHLRYWKAGELYYFGGSNGERGSNAAADCQALIMEGLPRENIGSALAHYHTLHQTDCSADNIDFQAWYNRQILDKVFQGIGRNRFARRADIIPTFIVGDGDLSELTSSYGLTIQQVDAFQICAEAGTPTQVNGWKIFQALKELSEKGVKLLQRQVGELTHLAQSTISEFARMVGGWKPLIKISEVLFRGLYNTSDICELPELTEEERAILEEYMPLFLDIPPEEIAHEVGLIIRAYGLDSFLRIVGAAPLHIQVKMLTMVMRGLPVSFLSELMTLIDQGVAT